MKKLTQFTFLLAAPLALLVAFSAPALAQVPFSGFSASLDFVTPLAMAGLVAGMPVKLGGKIIPSGKPVDVDADERARLKANGALVSASLAEADDEPDTFDLADALQTLIAEGQDIASWNMKQINAALPVKVTRAQVDEALENIRAEEVATAQQSDAVKSAIHAIKALGDDAKAEDGSIDPLKIGAAFSENEKLDGATIQTAIAAINLENENG